MRPHLALPLSILAALLIATSAPADILELDWANAMGSTSADQPRSMAADSSGNVYLVGDFNGTVDFDPGVGTVNLVSGGGNDVYVAKFNSSGGLVWARSISGPASDFGEDIAVDASGNVYASGSFRNTADFDPSGATANLSAVGNGDVFVWKLNSAGNYVWARNMGASSNSASGQGIGVDSNGNVYLNGVFQGTVDFDPGAPNTNTASAGSQDSFIFKLNSLGAFQWVRTIGSTNTEIGRGIHVTTDGDVFATGIFGGTIDFDPGAPIVNLTAGGPWDAYVVKYDTSGALGWARQLGGTNVDEGTELALDPSGNLLVVGFFSGAADFDPGAGTSQITASGSSDAFLVKLTGAGNFMWARSMGGTGGTAADALSVDSNHSVYVAGGFAGVSDFGPFERTAVGANDGFITKVSAGGDFLWAHTLAGTQADAVNGIAASTDAVTFAGFFIGTMDFDPTAGVSQATSAGSGDIFVTRLAQDITPPQATAITPVTTSPTNAATIDFTVEFDEDVVNFNDAADLVITHTGTAHTAVNITGGPSVYNVTLTGVSGNGTLTLAVSLSSDTMDVAGIVVGASDTSAPVTIDNTDPVISNLIVTPPTAVAGQIVQIMVDTNESLTADPTVTINGNFATHVAKATDEYLYTVQATDPFGPAAIEVIAEDLAGNLGTLNNTTALTILDPNPQVPIAAFPAAILLAAIGAATLLTKRQ